MSILKLIGKVERAYQGWYSSTGATSGNSSEMKVVFSNSDNVSKIKALDFNYITINSIRFYITCTTSGRAGSKDFKMTFKPSIEGSSLTLRSAGIAFGDGKTAPTTYIDFLQNQNKILQWLQEGALNYQEGANEESLVLYSKDPSSEYNKISSSGATYSKNYTGLVTIGNPSYPNYDENNDPSPYFEIDYTLNKIELTNPPSQATLMEDLILSFNNPEKTYLQFLLDGKIFGQTSNLDSYKISGLLKSIDGTNLAESFSFNSKEFLTTLTIATYRDSSYSIETLIGSSSYPIKIIMPDTSAFQPTLTEITYEGATMWNNKLVILANHSALTFAAAGAGGRYGASIKNYLWTFPDGKTSNENQPQKKFTQEYSQKDVTVKITDTRGFSSTKSIKVNILTYKLPKIISFNGYRVNSTGDKDIYAGQYIKISTNTVDYSNLIDGVTNELTYSYFINEGKVNKNDKNLLSETVPVDKTAVIKLTIEDSLKNSATASFDLSSAAYLLHFLKNTNAVGIGCAASAPEEGQKGLITIGWPILFSAGIAGINFDSNSGLSKQGLATTLGVLSLSGGELSGDLILNQETSQKAFIVKRKVAEQNHSGEFLISANNGAIIRFLQNGSEKNRLTLGESMTILGQPLNLSSGGTGGKYTSFLDLRENGLKIKYYASESELPAVPIEGQIALVAI